MSIAEIEELQKKCFEKMEDDILAHEYSDAVCEYLKTNKITDEILSIIIMGIDIDRLTTFFDYVETIQRVDMQECWKLLKKNAQFKENPKNNTLKLLAGLIYMTMINNDNAMSIAPGIFSQFVAIINSEKKPMSDIIYNPILMDYCLIELPKKNVTFPTWKDLKISPKIAQVFIEIALDLVNKEASLIDSFELKKWLNNAKKEVTDEIERERIEAKIPKSKLEELQTILEHYTEVEKQFRDGVYREEQLQQEIVALNRQIAELNRQKNDLESQIRNLNGDMREQQKSLAEAGKEIEERKAINDAFDALKKNDEGALLRDIANELKAEYRDFKESESDEMDVQLGEIYREKIKNIFKILDKKGIKVD